MWRLTDHPISKTDSLMTWSDPDLAEARTEWGDGEAYPSYREARTVIQALQAQAVYDAESEVEAVDSLARICTFLTRPQNDEVMLIRILCDSLKDGWLPGSLVKDCFVVMASLEPNELKKLTGPSRTPVPVSGGTNTLATILQACEPSDKECGEGRQ